MGDLLRLVTCGSVDDGKSTLIGRLLYDSRQVLADQLAHVRQASTRRNGNGALDLALLTDGLRAEREQGITIDVAYRHFATPRRRFILADAPGHPQYTRNMVTGASTAAVALVLLDARHGVIEQSRRHLSLVGLLGIRHVVACVNKMDLVGWDEGAFAAIAAEACAIAARVGVEDVSAIPLSALHGDNVVAASERSPWYPGLALLEHLEAIDVAEQEASARRLPVQWVIRDGELDYRAYAGQVAGGTWRPGDEAIVAPAGLRTRIEGIDSFDGELAQAAAPLSVAVRLADAIDVGRGDVLADPAAPPAVARELEATLCWMSETPLRPGGRYAIKHATRWARAVVDAVADRLDVDSLERDASAEELNLNDVGRVRLRTTIPLAVDRYDANRTTGGFILVDEATNDTAAAGMVLAAPAP